MIVFNTTYTVDNASQHEWLYWMRTEYMPVVMETKLPVASRILRLMSDVGQQGTVMSVQFDFRDDVDYNTFVAEYAGLLYDRMSFRFGEKAISFSTMLEEIWSSTAQ